MCRCGVLAKALSTIPRRSRAVAETSEVVKDLRGRLIARPVCGGQEKLAVRWLESTTKIPTSCGSTWKNPGPPWGSAWELVDRAGMRGAVRGGAQIAEKHCNFIANLGGAQAADVLWLMQETRRRVHDLEGLWLEPEIRMWGFTPEELAAVGGCP